MFVARWLLLLGFALWAVGAGVLRGVGHLLLPRTAAPAAVLLAFTVIVVATVAHLVFRNVPVGTRGSAALMVMLPTLVLHGFATVFFPNVFPNIPADAVGVFAGWMMACCAGVALGARPHLSR